MRRLGFLFLLIPLMALPSGCASTATKSEWDLGFLATRDKDLEGNSRLRVLGPFFERRVAESGKSLTAVRPFYSRLAEPEKDRVLREYLWPVGMTRSMGQDTFWRFLFFYGNNFDNRTDDARYRVALFPFVFWGRDVKGEPYFCVFPLGGTLNEYLFQDRIVFALFPLYAHSSVKDVETYNVLWPCLSWTHGGGEERARFFPFYGQSARRDEWVKRFVLFPLWTSSEYNYPDSKGYAWMIFPLCGRVNMSDQQTWWVIPPFFRYASGKNYVGVNSPWPFVQYRSGDIDKLYIWPLWGHKTEGNVREWFALWPFVNGSQVSRPDYQITRFNALPFVTCEKVVEQPGSKAGNPDAERQASGDAGSGIADVGRDSSPSGRGQEHGSPYVKSRLFKLWPFFCYEREDDAYRTRVPDVWPGKPATSVEKNWSPLWTLYRRDRLEDAAEDELFWGLFRYRRDSEGVKKLSIFPLFCFSQTGPQEDAGKWSVLLGLLGYEREGLRRTLRLLYLPIRWEKDADTNDGRSAGHSDPASSLTVNSIEAQP